MLSRFLDYIHIERNYSELTLEAYKRDISEFCEFIGIEPQELTPQSATEYDVKNWLIKLMDEGLNARSVKRKLSALRSYWKYCLRVGLTDKDITQIIIAPKVDKPLPVFYKESEMEEVQKVGQLADDFASVRDSLVIEMLYETGMRRAEFLALKDKDIDLEQKQINVFGKRKKRRLIPIGNHLCKQIINYMEWRNQQFGANRADSFLVTDKGQAMTAYLLAKIVKAEMSKVSTLKKQSPHVLRHTFATTMLNNGADINTIKTLLGHASLAATQIYTHTTFEQLQQSYNKAHPRAKH